MPTWRAAEAAGGDERVAIIVLNHDKRDDTLECLESVMRLEGPERDVVLVDNASGDGTLEAVAERFPRVRRVRNDRNLGAAGGRNSGLRHAAAHLDASWLLFLDNDARVDPGFVRELLAARRGRDDVGIVCGRGYTAHPSRVLNSVGVSVNLWTGAVRDLGLGELDVGQYERERLVDACDGFGVLIHRELLERLGGFDERYNPYGYEDIDLCLRAARLGARTLYAPRALIWHKGCRIGRGPVPAYERAKVRGYFRMMREHASPLERASLALCIPVRGALVMGRLLLGGHLRAVTGQIRGLLDGLRPAALRAQRAAASAAPRDPGRDARRGPRIVAIGLEAGEPALLERWCDEGLLPNLRGLRERGCTRLLRSPTEISSGATWASVNTGCSPAKHGIGFYHRQLRTGTYRIVKKYAGDAKREPFWLRLARAGHRVAVLDVPESYVVRDFGGVLLVGWGGEAPNAKKGSWPPGLFPSVIERFGRHPLDGWYQARPHGAAGWRRFRECLERSVRTRSALASSVLEQEPWDLFLAAFPESHWAGHFFWHLMDDHHPDHDRALAEAAGDAILRVYREIDEAIGKLLERAPDANVLVFSNTGMGPNYSGAHLLPEVLERLGLAGRKAREDAGSRARRWGPYAVKTVERWVTPRAIERVRRVVPERVWDGLTRRLLTLGNGWARSRAFCVPGDYAGAIRINLRGREPRGTVLPGAEYDALCAELAREIEALVDPETGRPVVERVVKVRERYRGENVDDLPDLVVWWRGERSIRALRSLRIGTVQGDLPDKRSGAHLTHGFLIAAGPGIAAGGTLGPADVVDLAPTLFHLLGETPPADFDGSALLDLLDS
jgi:GT2 family glycosyltransferase/predicted AlkP superfamily phosphohydrolase/phosphomutase